VNEIQLIRAQLDTERLHVNAVAKACAAAPGAAQGRVALAGPALAQLRAAATDYLLCVLGWFEARDQRLIELLGARAGGDEPARHALQTVLAQPGSSQEALVLHTNAAGWPAWAQFIEEVWDPRRQAIDASMGEITRPADWRALAGIDADSILDERRRFERVRAACPPGDEARC
jgi:hypothetical protein